MRAVERSVAQVRSEWRRSVVGTEQDIAPPGHVVTLAWAAAEGATDLELTEAALFLDTALVVHDQESLPVAVSGSSADITIPAHERVRALHLDELRHDGATDLLDEAGLAVAGLRLTVSLSTGGAFSPPVHAAPAVSGGQMLPPVMGGASYAGGVLGLHDVAASKLRLNLVNGDTPTEFAPQALSLAGASGVTVLPTRGLSVLGPDGATLFAVPEELPDVRGGHEVDLKPALKQAFSAALAGGAPLQAAFTVRGEAGCKAYVSVRPPRGALLRVESGVLRTEVAGAPEPLALAGPLDVHAPHSARGDLTVSYLGLRVLAEVSDAVPAAGGAQGVVVRESAVLRALPLGAFAGLPLARVGLIGRAPEPCELSLQLCEDLGGTAGKALGKPGTCKLQPSTATPSRLDCHWIDLPPLPESAASATRVLLALRVTSGRFFWATGGSAAGAAGAGAAAANAAGSPGAQGAAGTPLARFAVRDPDPGGRALKFAGHTLLALHASDVHLPDFAFPAAKFSRGAAGAGVASATTSGVAGLATGPLFDSDLFLTVDVSDLTLRYAR